MAFSFSRSHLIIISTYFFLLFIPFAASLSFNFTNIRTQRKQNQDIVLEGEGHVPYISNSGVQLTPDGIDSNRSWKAGRMTYIRSLHLWDKTSGELSLASFKTSFSFVIDSNSTEYGDGLTFFLAKNNSEITPGAVMGRPENATKYPFVSVEFDTFWNSGWDPTDSRNNPIGDHVGININSLNSSSYQKWFSNVTGGRECQAWIKYDSRLKNLSVSFTGFRNNTVIRQVGLYYTIDLRDVLPEWVIFGLSAATGDLNQTNNVRSWTFNSFKWVVLIDPGNDKNSSVGLLIFGLFVLITFCTVLAFVLRRKSRDDEAGEPGFDVVEMDNEFEMGTERIESGKRHLAAATQEIALKRRISSLETQVSEILQIVKAQSSIIQSLGPASSSAQQSTPSSTLDHDILLDKVQTQPNAQSAHLSSLTNEVRMPDNKVGAFRDDLKQDWNILNSKLSASITSSSVDDAKKEERSKGKGKMVEPEKKKVAEGGSGGERLMLSKLGEAERAFFARQVQEEKDHQLALMVQAEQEEEIRSQSSQRASSQSSRRSPSFSTTKIAKMVASAPDLSALLPDPNHVFCFDLPDLHVRDPGTVIMKPEYGMYIVSSENQYRFVRIRDLPHINNLILGQILSQCRNDALGRRIQGLINGILEGRKKLEEQRESSKSRS